jgi:hypothetical protein
MFLQVLVWQVQVISSETLQILCFVIGVMLGSFSVFYLYIAAFKIIENKTTFLMKNINTIIGSITAAIAVFTVFKLLCD